jgi:stringent starvation protein B
MQTTQPQVDPKKLTNKISALNELLSTHYSVYVHVDSRRPGVIVPPTLKQPQLVLQLGLNMPNPIRALLIDEKGFSATLSFGATPTQVFVPWDAVFLIVGDSGIGCQYPKDAPPEALVKQERVASGAAPLPTNRDPEKHKKLPPGWGVIDGGKK